MADDIDNLTEREARDFSRFKPHDFTKESSIYCLECDEKIPERRRKVGNIHYCVSCQERIEKKSKHIR